MNAIGQRSNVATSGTAYQYDAIGNRIDVQVLPLGSSSLASCVYGWDAENRLSTVSVTGGDTEHNLYDAQSRLIARSVGVSPTTTTTLYLYDGWNCIAEYSITNNSPITLHKTYLWGLDLSGTLQGAGGVNGLLSESHISDPQSPIYYPLYDGNRNVSEYLAADGSNAAYFEYDPFGNTLPTSIGNIGWFNYRFSTKPQDFETGLYYYGYRYYDPVTGRWPSRDPIGEDGGINLYAMVLNGTINYFDILGRNVRVNFDCTLISPAAPSRPTIPSLFKNCDYTCVETTREQLANGGPPLLDDLPEAPIRITTTSRQFFSCSKTLKTFRVFMNDSLKIDCSRSSCRTGCDLTAAAGLASPNPIVRTAALAARTICYDTCNTICDKP